VFENLISEDLRGKFFVLPHQRKSCARIAYTAISASLQDEKLCSHIRTFA
jgi:hypothetical protein